MNTGGDTPCYPVNVGTHRSSSHYIPEISSSSCEGKLMINDSRDNNHHNSAPADCADSHTQTHTAVILCCIRT